MEICHWQRVKMASFLINSYQSICGKVYFSKVLCFQHILMNTFRRVRLKHEHYHLRDIYFRHSSSIAAWKIKSLIAKTFDKNTWKKYYLGKTRTKALFPAGSPSDLYFRLAFPFFECPSKITHLKNQGRWN